MKAKWTKKIPTEEGWYWCKLKGQHGMSKCPCLILCLGPKIEVPE